jgi:signal peptide peptidase SppA
MRDYGQIITKIGSAPWFITEDGLRLVMGIVDYHLSGQVSLEEIRARTKEAGGRKTTAISTEGAVGLLSLQGPIFPKANMMTEFSGATSIEQWTTDFKALMANERVDTILLNVDSPGGIADMIPETARMIREASKEKRIVAVANTMAGSAAYMLASQANELYASESAYVGSVGAYLIHTDDSELKDKLGVTQTVIKEGRLKAALITPLTPETREHLQEVVGDSYDSFVNAVAEGRNTTVEDVVANYGEGGVVSAKRALESGMIDGVQTYNQVLNSLLDGGGTVVQATEKSSGFGSGFLKASYDKEKEHSEPGTGLGGEPVMIPKENEDVDEWKRGERFQPGYVPEVEDNAMNHEQLVAMAARLGVNCTDLTDEQIVTALDSRISENLDLVAEIQQGTQAAEKQIEFAKQFPEQAEKLRKLEETGQKHDAAEFASGLADITISEEGKDALRFRLSALAQTTVRDTHFKLSQSNLTHDDLALLVKNVAVGVVSQGEKGSSRVEEQIEDGVVQGASVKENRQAFADRVATLMKDDNLSRKDAIAEASVRWPKLAEAYARS